MTTIILHAITFRYQRSTQAWIDYLPRVSLVFHINLCENKEIDTRKYSIFESVKSRLIQFDAEKPSLSLFLSTWRRQFFAIWFANVARLPKPLCDVVADGASVRWTALLFGIQILILSLFIETSFLFALWNCTLLLIWLHTIFFFVSVFFIKLMKTIAQILSAVQC